MNHNIITTTTLLLGIGLSTVTTIKPAYSETTFYCNKVQKTTIMRTSLGEIPMITWYDGSFPPPYTPLVRCLEVTARFNKFNNNGTLKYLRTSTLNNYPVICVAAYKGGSCLPNGLLITLKPGSDANETLTRILDSRMWAMTDSPVYLSDKENSEQLVTEVDGVVFVNIESLLNQ